MLSLPPPLSLLQLFPPIPTEWGLEQGMTLIISLAIWLQGGESVECVFSVARELQDESGLCVCVSYTGLVLMSAELSEDVLGVGGAYADLREV